MLQQVAAVVVRAVCYHEQAIQLRSPPLQSVSLLHLQLVTQILQRHPPALKPPQMIHEPLLHQTQWPLWGQMRELHLLSLSATQRLP